MMGKCLCFFCRPLTFVKINFFKKSFRGTWFESNLFVKVRDKSASEYDQEMPQSHTADQPTAPRGRAAATKERVN